MPIAIKPGGTWWYTLRCDRDEADPPRFELKYLTGREQLDLADKLDAIGEADGEKPPSSRQGVEDAFRALDGVCVGWKGLTGRQGVAINPDVLDADLRDAIGYAEALELAYAAFHGMTEHDRKNSGSRSASGPAAGARDAQD